jgi:site-specific recombinase XerD
MRAAPENTFRSRPDNTFDDASFAVWRDFERDLQAKLCRPYTIQCYGWALVQLYQSAGAVPLVAMTRDHVTRYLIGLRDADWSRATVDTRYRALRRFYRWCHAEELVTADPTARIPRPQQGSKPVETVTAEDLAALLRACQGKDYESLRDTALIRLALAPGAPRASELCGITLDCLDMRHDTALIREGKWARDRLVPFGPLAGKALSRYLRARAARPDAARYQEAFLGRKGPLSRSGLQQMLRRRCAQAGIAAIHPHQLRHTSVIACKRARMDVATGKKLFGWSSGKMWEHYGESAAAELAVEQGRAAAGGMEIAL